ncbi:SNARE protein [Anaeramoeba ignava]|uniref:SNARE protein n=1 Tax=Anaeramoeba ignava TaxID=1746090 RepID=A0A9Q0LPL8_ANAIG|nr:SNARE protein [Anaeramoeba ignava]
MNDLIRRIVKIQHETAPEGVNESESHENYDDFTKLKKGIAVDVKEIRESIARRNDLLETTNPDNVEAIQLSSSIRKKIGEVKEKAIELDELQKLGYKKPKKDKKKKKQQQNEDSEDIELEDVNENRAEIVELVNAHIKECEDWDKQRYKPQTKYGNNLTSNSHSARVNIHSPLQTELNDIDTAQKMQLIRQKDNQIDADLDEISHGVGHLKEIALTMSEEVDKQNVMLDEVTTKVDNTTEHLENINKKLRRVISEAKSADKIVCYIILLVLLLGILGYIYKLAK